MAIELEFKGICKGCTKADLKLRSVRNITNDDAIFAVYSVECRHERACTRLYEMAETGKLERICGHCGVFEGDPKDMLGYCPLHYRNVWRDDGICGDFRPKGWEDKNNE